MVCLIILLNLDNIWLFKQSDHILQIIKIYDEALNLEKERKQCIRKPKPFIGSILRKPVKANTFKTFDKISVFQKAILPPGNEIPILKTVDGNTI